MRESESWHGHVLLDVATHPATTPADSTAQTQQPTTLNKEREWAGCRLCGAVYQPYLAMHCPTEEYTADVMYAVTCLIAEWRIKHNRTHADREHVYLAQSGLAFTPDAAHALEPYGMIALSDVHPLRPYTDETACALLESNAASARPIEH